MADGPWYRIDPSLFTSVKQEVLARHPRLEFVRSGDAMLVRGVIELSEGGRTHDEYQIELEVSPESPVEIPKVREIGGRIPHHVDRHVNPQDGTLCVVLPDAYWYHYPGGLNLPDFLSGPLRTYLASQSLVEMGEPWPAGEWSHGFEGILEFYAELLGTQDPAQLHGLLDLLGRPKVGGVGNCPCGSGRRFRQCHSARIFELRRKVSRRLARRASRYLERLLEQADLSR